MPLLPISIQTIAGGIKEVIEKLRVKTLIIGKQFEDSENLQDFLKIVKEKNIKVNVVEAGTRINIEKTLHFNVLWPNSKQVISENSINNNALVCKLYYKNFTMLFTGDIEEPAEEDICEIYGNTDILKALVLKVAHHGSKTSSTENFLDLVQPKIALIGVGQNNKYGHPNLDVLTRIENLRYKSL